jgi:dTDP-4-dehydrorhamnose 3,5-epimerase-like enzyme
VNSAIAVVKQKMTDSRRQFFAAVKKSEFQGLKEDADITQVSFPVSWAHISRPLRDQITIN